MDAYFKKGWPPKFNMEHYALRDAAIRKMAAAGCNDAEKERPFVSPRLWGIFFIIRAVYGRLGYLCERSFEERRFIDWRADSGIDQQLRTTLPAQHAPDASRGSLPHDKRRSQTGQAEALRRPPRALRCAAAGRGSRAHPC
jgi:hypothetical protein